MAEEANDIKHKLLSTVVLLIFVCSLFAMVLPTVPASAGTLSWATPEKIPSTENKVIEFFTINDFAVASDGDTIYAVLTGNKLYKSTDAGATWVPLISPAAASVSLVAIAPGNDSIVVVYDPASNVVWISTNAGSSFTSLGNPTAGNATAMTAVNALAISPAVSGVTNIALGGAIGGAVAVCYFNYGAAVTKWVDAANDAAANGWTDNISAGATSVAAVAFSPSFASDRVIGVVSTNGSAAKFEVASFASKKWNANVGGYTGYPVSLIGTGVTALTADLVFAANYLGADSTTRLVFIGTTETGGANAPGAIYRLEDNTVKALKTGVGIKSVAYNIQATKLVAGESGTNTVWRSSNPTASSVTVTATGSTYKKPGVDGKTTGIMVAWVGTNVFAAGTGGTDGAFSVSTNDGMTFNDISLVNTPMTNLVDVAISSDGTVKYLLSNDSADLSVWRYITSWERVRAFTPATLNYIIRLAPEDANVIYLAETGTNQMWQSTDAGETQWTLRFSDVVVQDVAVESALVLYVAEQSTKNVIKSNDGGSLWSNAMYTKLISGNNYMINSIVSDQVIVGSTGGYVSYTTDGGANWTAISTIAETVATNLHVTADNLTNGFIYAVGRVNGNIRRWKIDPATTSWSDIINDSISGNATGISLTDGVLYVLSADSGTSTSYLYRESMPSTATSATVWSSVAATSALFNRTPQALKVSSGPKLWAINTFPVQDTLLSLDDAVSQTAPILVSPVEGFQNPVNLVTGHAYNVVFVWTRLSVATAYELQIAYVSSFTQLIATHSVNGTEEMVSVIIGPETVPNLALYVEYEPGITYFWRVRVTSPLYSPWSEARSFNVQPFLRGDANGDGELNALDITMVERMIAGLE